jgi:tetratricopeptide (TPR) repeat protein
LAERAEEDQVLATYEAAYKLDPDNASVAIRYGCQLFLREQFKEARERFREACVHDPKNGLPGYLEAAAAQWATPNNEDLAESLALVARTNNSGETVVFPLPSWPAGILPQNGYWFAKLRREAVDESCALLYQYEDLVLARAERDFKQGQMQYWDSWLETLETMGQRVMSSPDNGSLQAIAGIQIQLRAIELRNRIWELGTGSPKAELTERHWELRRGLETLNQFERSRDDLVAASRETYVLPLLLCFFSGLGLFAFYMLIYAAAKLAHVGRHSWTVPHTRLAKGVLVTGNAALLAVLCAVSLLQRKGELEGAWQEWAIYPWAAALLGMLLFGVFYPSLTLPGPRRLLDAAGNPEDTEGFLRAARSTRRVAGISLMRRYYGVLMGLFLCVVSCWGVLYRIGVSLYPWQVKLLATGLADREVDLVRQVLDMLQ